MIMSELDRLCSNKIIYAMALKGAARAKSLFVLLKNASRCANMIVAANLM